MEITHTRACVSRAIPHGYRGVINSTGPNLPPSGWLLSDCYKALPLHKAVAGLLMKLLDRAIPAIYGFRFTRTLTDVAS